VTAVHKAYPKKLRNVHIFNNSGMSALFIISRFSILEWQLLLFSHKWHKTGRWRNGDNHFSGSNITLAYSLTLKMEATCSSETPLTFNGLHSIIFEKTTLHNHCYVNLKFCLLVSYLKNRKTCGESILEIKSLLNFALQLCSDVYLASKPQDVHKNV
jgi:hypothetical protein